MPNFRLLAAFLVATVVVTTSVDARENSRDWLLCGQQTARYERAQGIPNNLLTAISHVESGRYHRAMRRRAAWPWTVMAEGRGRYLGSKKAAIREVRQLQLRGVKNIDVGCMQINLQWHPHAFSSLSWAFDPAQNVAYAARFLRHLRIESRSWNKAVQHYHSRTPKYYRSYHKKVVAAFNKVRKRKPSIDQTARRSRRSEPRSKWVSVADLSLERPGMVPPKKPGRKAKTKRPGREVKVRKRRARRGQVIVQRGSDQVVENPG